MADVDLESEAKGTRSSRVPSIEEQAVLSKYEGVSGNF